jgi:DNA-binding transcriptional LysR family regulator
MGIKTPMVFQSSVTLGAGHDPRRGMGFFRNSSIPDDLPVRRLTEPTFERNIQLVTVRGRPHSPAVGAFVRAARAHKWPRAANLDK